MCELKLRKSTGCHGNSGAVNMEDEQVEKKKQDIDIQECEPANTAISREDTIRDVDFQECEDTIRDVDFQEDEAMEKKGSTKDDILEALVYVNRVLNGLEGQPELISKFFDLMGEYRSDLDQEKLKRRLFALFESHPEFEIEFTLFNNQEPSPVREKAECSGRKKDDLKNPLEEIKNKYEDEMLNNNMCISKINSAIDNTVRFLMVCRRQKKTMDVTRYLTNENVKEIAEHCKVNLKNCKHPQESAYSVVGILKVQLEVAKEKGPKIAGDMASEIQKLQNNKRKNMD